MPSRKNLTREHVLAGALDMLAADGVQDFSLRRLADQLGVASPAVSWHVGSRDTLLLDVVEQFLEQLVLPAAGSAPWEDWLRLFASALRGGLLTGGRLAPVVLDLMPLARPSLDITAAVLDTLYDAGYRDAQLFQLHNAYMGYVLGFTALEVNQRSLSLRHEPDPVVRARLETAALAHPSAHARWLFGPGPEPAGFTEPDDSSQLDASFRVGLDALLRGQSRPAARVKRRGKRLN